MPIALDSSDAELLAEVRAWLDLLSVGKFAEALQRIPGEQDEDWTPQLLEEVVAGYGLTVLHSSGSRFLVTPPNKALGTLPVASVERVLTPPGTVAYIEHSIPLNGQWSDLTATFVLCPSNSHAVLRLQEVHVF